MLKKLSFGLLALAVTLLPLSPLSRTGTAVAQQTNLIANASFETSTDGTTPDSWQTSNYSTVTNGNTATFSYLNTGHTGGHSAEVQVTKFTDGDANWYYGDQPVTAGTTYQFSDWYQSNIDTEVDAEVIVNGVAQYYKVGEAFANTGWTSFSSTFTAPAGATSMSLYHLIAGVGYLITDDYDLSAYTPTPFVRPMVSVTFDDGWLNQYQNAVPVLTQLGIPATFYIISGSSVTTPDPEYMNATQVKALADAPIGNEIGSHTVHHCDLTGLQTDDAKACPLGITPTQVDSELKDSQTALQNLIGKPVTDFAYPYGAYDPATIADGLKYYQSQRTVNSGYDTKDSLDPTQLKMFEVDSNITVGQVEAWIDGAIANNTWLILTYHEVGTQPENPGDDDALYTTQTADFIAEMAYLSSKTGVGIETVSNALHEAQNQPTADTTPPAITSLPVTDLTTSGATVNWSTDEASTTQVNYGLDATYGSSTTLDPTLSTAHTAALSGLTANTTYHYQVVSTDAAGNTAKSADLTFTTPAVADTTPPVISSVATLNLTATGVTINWSTDEASTSMANFGLDATYGTATTLDPSLATIHAVTLSGLTANTTYHYQVVSTDAAGNTAPSGDFTFTTLPAIVVTLPGDINGDNSVNGLDLSTVLANWHPTAPSATPLVGDVNGDGLVNGLDVSTVLANWSKQ